jgi:hypothetical protein
VGALISHTATASHGVFLSWAVRIEGSVVGLKVGGKCLSFYLIAKGSTNESPWKE